MNRKICMLILLIIAILSTTTVFGARFSDTEGHWAENVIEEMASKGILNGFGDGTFKPDESVTREQFAKILVESLELEEKDSSVEFLDVENGRWSKAYIETASKYLTGYTNNGKYYFRPTEATVREDVAVAVVMAKGLQNETPNYDLLKQFSDEDKISDALRKYIAIAVEHEIMIGKGGYFDPQGNLTRAEVSQLLYNVYTKVPIGEIEDEEHVHETIAEYVYKNETQHTVKTVCKICEEVINSKTEKHTFANGKCVCGVEEKEELICGDVNNDGKVDSVDVLRLRLYVGEKTEDINLKNADVNNDSKIDENDITILSSFVANKIDKLPHTCEFINNKCICGIEKANQETIVYGDATGDGKVNTGDSSAVRAHLSGSSVLVGEKFKNADVDLDGKITENDLWLIRGYVSKIISKLPHNCTSHTIKYEKVDDEKHQIIENCKCGEISYKNTETHTFENGECICGAEEINYGDINGDGKLTEDDSLLLFQYSLYPEVYGKDVVENAKKVGDLNEDNLLDIDDSVILSAYIEGKISQIPHECTFVNNICNCGIEK